LAGSLAGRIVHLFQVLENETIARFRRFTDSTVLAMMIDPRAKLLAVLDHAEEYRGLALRAKDRGERVSYEHIVELYVEIAEELEALMDR
jgi:hypothetical protein